MLHCAGANKTGKSTIEKKNYAWLHYYLLIYAIEIE